MLVEVVVECPDLRQDAAQLIALDASEFGELEHGQPVIGQAADVARMADDLHGQLRKAARQYGDEVVHMLGRGVVDEDQDIVGIGLQRRDRLDGWHQVGGRLVGERHDGDVGDLGRLDDAALDEPAEVDDERRSLEVLRPVLDGLAWLQGDDAAVRESGVVDVGGAVVEVVGEEHAAAVLCVADGMRRLTLPSLDGVEEYAHGCIDYGIIPIFY